MWKIKLFLPTSTYKVRDSNSIDHLGPNHMSVSDLLMSSKAVWAILIVVMLWGIDPFFPDPNPPSFPPPPKKFILSTVHIPTSAGIYIKESTLGHVSSS